VHQVCRFPRLVPGCTVSKTQKVILKNVDAASFLKQNKETSPFCSLSLEQNKILKILKYLLTTLEPNLTTSASVSMEEKLAELCVLGQRALLFDVCSYHLIRQAKQQCFGTDRAEGPSCQVANTCTFIITVDMCV